MDLRNYFHKREAIVAKELGVSETKLKSVCRAAQLSRWPFRSLQAVCPSCCIDCSCHVFGSLLCAMIQAAYHRCLRVRVAKHKPHAGSLQVLSSTLAEKQA